MRRLQALEMCRLAWRCDVMEAIEAEAPTSRVHPSRRWLALPTTDPGRHGAWKGGRSSNGRRRRGVRCTVHHLLLLHRPSHGHQPSTFRIGKRTIELGCYSGSSRSAGE